MKSGTRNTRGVCVCNISHHSICELCQFNSLIMPIMWHYINQFTRANGGGGSKVHKTFNYKWVNWTLPTINTLDGGLLYTYILYMTSVYLAPHPAIISCFYYYYWAKAPPLYLHIATLGNETSLYRGNNTERRSDWLTSSRSHTFIHNRR